MWFPEDFWLAEKCKRRCCQLESTRPAKQWNANLSIFAKLCYIATSDKRQRKRHVSVAQIIPALGKPFSCVHAFVFFILIASGWVGDENAGGRVNSGETDGQNLPADGQEHGRQALPWGVHWGLAIVLSPPSSSIPTLVSSWVGRDDFYKGIGYRKKHFGLYGKSWGGALYPPRTPPLWQNFFKKGKKWILLIFSLFIWPNGFLCF